jgi:hypothetical protein
MNRDLEDIQWHLKMVLNHQETMKSNASKIITEIEEIKKTQKIMMTDILFKLDVLLGEKAERLMNEDDDD